MRTRRIELYTGNRRSIVCKDGKDTNDPAWQAARLVSLDKLRPLIEAAVDEMLQGELARALETHGVEIIGVRVHKGRSVCDVELAARKRKAGGCAHPAAERAGYGKGREDGRPER